MPFSIKRLEPAGWMLLLACDEPSLKSTVSKGGGGTKSGRWCRESGENAAAEAVKQRSIKSGERKKRSKKMKRTKCFSSSIQLFIQPCFSIQPADKIKRREERAHKTPIHKIKPIPNFYLGQIVCFKCVVWRSLSVFSFSLCGHEHRLFFYFLCLLVHVLQEAIFTSLLSLPLVMCYSYIELLFTKHNHKAIGHLHHRSVNIRGWKRTSWDDWEYFQSRLFFVTLRISNYCHYQK